MEFYTGFAGLTFLIRPNYEQLYPYCRGFYREPEDDAFDASVTTEEIEAEADKFSSVRTSPMLESLAVYRKISEYLPYKDSFLFHASALAVDGEAYVFAAESGTGKSTHARLWRQCFGDRVTMVNDDKPVITVKDGKTYISGTPWNGKHRLSTDITVPVKAICFLQRGKENRIEKADADTVFEKLWAQTYKPAEKEALMHTLRLLSAVMQTVDFYRLECNMEPEAAEISYNGMKRGFK
ncbi:MAG: hypothetical protein IJT49_03635 [Clostridia bacterium]|nr:hypothetical protein [Clostridia bacterium]